jgi:hypothetical protein
MLFEKRHAGGVIGWTAAVAFLSGLAVFFVLNTGLDWWFHARRGASNPCWVRGAPPVTRQAPRPPGPLAEAALEVAIGGSLVRRSISRIAHVATTTDVILRV